MCHTGVYIEASAESERRAGMRQTHQIFGDPALLLRRAEADEDNLGSGTRDLVEERRVVVKISVTRTDYAQARVGSRETRRGSLGYPGRAT